ncbi:hypothetical protein Fmac_005578 [Flemingia macrophylla]|uniref:Ribosomal protein S12 n=1 Tax=Flemingia macrophylla TaxID=520843 RepID=A0ABD1N863_9FABA
MSKRSLAGLWLRSICCDGHGDVRRTPKKISGAIKKDSDQARSPIQVRVE